MSQTPQRNDPRYPGSKQRPRQSAHNGWSTSPPSVPPQTKSYSPADQRQPAQIPQTASKTPLWITIGVLSFFLVVALVVGGIFAFKSIFANQLATDFDDGEVVAEESTEETAVEDYNTDWTVDDLIAATCPSGAFYDSSTGFLPGATTLGTCTGSMTNSSSVIEYGTYPSKFLAENDVSKALNGNLMSAYVLEQLSSGDFLVIVGYDSSDLVPVTDQYGVQVNTN